MSSGIRLDMIVFDFDGTICDSARIKDEAFRVLYLDEMGEAFADLVLEYHLENAGVSRFDKIRHIEEQMIGRTSSERRLAEVAERFGLMVEDRVVSAPLIAGAQEFVESPMNSVVLTVASATPTKELQRIVYRRGLTHYFAAVEGSPETKGDIVRSYLERFEVDARRAVMVGDQMSDYRAAVEAGVAFVGVGDNSPLLENTVALIADLTELRAALAVAFPDSGASTPAD